MKKDTEELILSEIIRLNTEVVKIHSKLGYIGDDIKGIHKTLKEHNDRFDGLENKVDRGFDDIHYMFDKRTVALEAAV